MAKYTVYIFIKSWFLSRSHKKRHQDSRSRLGLARNFELSLVSDIKKIRQSCLVKKVSIHFFFVSVLYWIYVGLISRSRSCHKKLVSSHPASVFFSTTINFDNLVWVVIKTEFDYVGCKINLDLRYLQYFVVYTKIQCKFCDNFPLIWQIIVFLLQVIWQRGIY